MTMRNTNLFRMLFLAMLTIVVSLAAAPERADAFGGRGYARRQVRRAVPYAYPARVYAPVVVQPVYAAPVVTRYRAPAYNYYPQVPVRASRYGSYYGSGYPSYGGISIGISW